MSAAHAVKTFKSIDAQIELLRSRGMKIDQEQYAREMLERISYYRLSGYWYPFRKFVSGTPLRGDEFVEDTTFEQIMALYEFDTELRSTVFNLLSAIELTFRSKLGYELGKINPLIHLSPENLGPLARQPASKTKGSSEYKKWLQRYTRELTNSREDFVSHHNSKYQGQLPVWVAVEVLDFGSVNYLYRLAPEKTREQIAQEVGLSAPQLGSWIKSLNILRNYSAHHARMFNRVYTLKPRLPRQEQVPELSEIRDITNRCFGQLTLIQYLLMKMGLEGAHLLPELLNTYPTGISAVPVRHVGAPGNWQALDLWRVDS